MSANKHTPGPWFVRDAPNGYTYIRDHAGVELAVPSSENMLVEGSAAANAKLMAAAPLMLQMLRVLSDCCAENSNKNPQKLEDARIAALSIIAYATGEEA